MSLPIVAIVGRPNVGKSSLLNALVGKRISIVEDTPGVTRDRVAIPCPVGPEAYVELVDTGGMGIEDSQDLTDHVEAQIRYAIEAAELILFVVDAREGITSLDRHVATQLRKLNKQVILVANKIDELNLVSEVHEFARLGFGQPVNVSAAHANGISDLRDLLAGRMKDLAEDRPAEPVMKLAVVGKRNAGKSTFINALAGEQRVIVSEKAGTTRDSVDVTVEADGRSLTIIDTAGVRKKRKMDGDVEFYSYHRALRSIRRADVVALMIDASVPLGQVDKSLAREVADQHKPVLFVVNKWDLAEGTANPGDYEEYLGKVFPSLAFAPISLTAAHTGMNVHQTIRLAGELFAQSQTRMGTAELNEAVQGILEQRGPSHKHGTRPPKIYYVTQVATGPPTIVCFVNDVRSFDTSYQRFLLNRLRETTPFAEVPIRLLFRPRQKDRGGG